MNLNQAQLAALANLPAIREALALADAEALQARQALVDQLTAAIEEAQPEIARHLATAEAALKRVGELKDEIKAQQQIEGVARYAASRLQIQLERKSTAIRDNLARTVDPMLSKFHEWAAHASCALANFGWRETVVATEGDISKPVMQRERDRSLEARRLANIATAAQQWAVAQLSEATPKAELVAYTGQVSNELVAGALAIGYQLKGFEQ